ncbi:glycosyltransferase family 9 protein [Nitratifractor salsuginis]|uniref:Lipopolysaccharide heptosyltransferase II n=1 Tax=Nitratifractor salsuginis (strain DSM 16511 / JCM 12458 / E9I37-1) TaxID=749222 RepID=E6WZN1_NITSE|nr:glycosyltransferase family 9 protein [Nitratifractor salsuginis]ADV46672.1 lipopolysaccharide heptosyltransferase II [Nitratifractor salsuginis DSM 16511]
MKILIELPTWLGDAVMSTPALENLFAAYPKAQITLTGSYLSTEALRAHPRVNRVVVDRTKSRGFRPLNIYKLAKELGPHNLAITFRSHFSSKLLLILTGSKKIHQFKPSTLNAQRSTLHHVQRYQAFINSITGRKDVPGPLKLYWPKAEYPRPTLGINPGATYGSAKRWYPEKFAEVAAALADRFDIVIFGGPGETDIASDIERMIREKGVKNLENLAGKTTIPRLCSQIAGLDLFITGDSGPMHIAAAYQVPSVAIFGPTKWLETSQWMNPHSHIVRHDLECAPCMKRQCHLKHHACMKEITPQEVIEAAQEMLLNMNDSAINA